MLKKFLDIRLGNVVLVSSVLPETYPWESLLKNRPDCVLNVRNEFGTMDNVTKLVAKLQWLVGDLGASGAVGFNGDAAVIHTSKQPMADCGSAVKVHNVPLEGYEHSTQLLGAGHAARVWLPFLWGLSPDEFWRYLEACQAAARFTEEYQVKLAGPLVTELWNSAFTWTNTRPLAEFAMDEIRAQLERRKIESTLSTIDELADEVMTEFHVMTDMACSEAAKRNPRIDIVRCIYPRYAIGRTVHSVVERRWPPR